jgi:hypothetical protein
MSAIINIIQANYLGRYSIELEFADGTRQKVNFEPFLKKSLHPEIRAFLNQDKFMQFRIEYGDLIWGDYELCFPVKDLYTNQICHGNAGLIAA